jgi:hypothetical protein
MTKIITALNVIKNKALLLKIFVGSCLIWSLIGHVSELMW